MFPIDQVLQILIIWPLACATVVTHERVQSLVLIYLDKLIISVSGEGSLTCWSESRCLDPSSIVSQLVDQIGSYGHLR